MKILIISNTVIPTQVYGGTERVIWWLGKALVQLGHDVTYLVKNGSACPFARVLTLQEKKPLVPQIPEDCDIIHLHMETSEALPKPALTTIHQNYPAPKIFDRNTVFISSDHATRHGGSVFVHHGIDFEEYGAPQLDNRRMYFHFLGNAARRERNLNGAIATAAEAGERLHVIGGHRINFLAGLRITLSPYVRFHGLLGGDGKNAILNSSKGLVLPVLRHEPFGLAVIESLYFGCPLFGTPYGALPELLGRKTNPAKIAKKAAQNGHHDMAGSNWGVGFAPVPTRGGSVEAFYSDLGCLSIKKAELAEALKNAGQYNRRTCHEYAVAHFSARRMAEQYTILYEKVLDGYTLHEAPPAAIATDEKLFFT